MVQICGPNYVLFTINGLYLQYHVYCSSNDITGWAEAEFMKMTPDSKNVMIRLFELGIITQDGKVYQDKLKQEMKPCDRKWLSENK